MWIMSSSVIRPAHVAGTFSTPSPPSAVAEEVLLLVAPLPLFGQSASRVVELVLRRNLSTRTDWDVQSCVGNGETTVQKQGHWKPTSAVWLGITKMRKTVNTNHFRLQVQLLQVYKLHAIKCKLCLSRKQDWYGVLVDANLHNVSCYPRFC
jgi:hypothetical protein